MRWHTGRTEVADSIVKLNSKIVALLLMMTIAPAAAAEQNAVVPAEQLAARPDVARALDWLARNVNWVTEQHIKINETPAPTFSERGRGLVVRKMLEGTGFKLRFDDVGNLIAEKQAPGPSGRGAKQDRDVVIVAAHLDTVFPFGTDVKVKRDGVRMIAPGISDNASGLAAMVALAHALHTARVQPHTTIVLAANVGEEGEGNLRGIRKLMETYKGRVRAVIAVDGASVEHVTTMALGSRRYEVTISGPGGHSWADFGQANPIHAMSRSIARFVRVKVPSEPRTTFNVGHVEGGTSVNSIPYSASVKVDLRSESEPELQRLEAAFKEAMQGGVDDEQAAARERGVNGNGAKLELKIKLLGSRPGGDLPADSFLLAAVRGADRFLGNRSRPERSSTDANIPLSQGVPAIAIGGGGRGGGSHSLTEWYDPGNRELGLKRLLLILLSVTGVEE
jgi:acetylornithine deacetylase/succinyl-diaminopimelate desuccinylase-like protein